MNSRTQAIVCDDLGMIDYVIYSNVGSDKFDMKTKQKADLLECKSFQLIQMLVHIEVVWRNAWSAHEIIHMSGNWWKYVLTLPRLAAS